MCPFHIHCTSGTFLPSLTVVTLTSSKVSLESMAWHLVLICHQAISGGIMFLLLRSMKSSHSMGWSAVILFQWLGCLQIS